MVYQREEVVGRAIRLKMTSDDYDKHGAGETPIARSPPSSTLRCTIAGWEEPAIKYSFAAERRTRTLSRVARRTSASPNLRPVDTRSTWDGCAARRHKLPRLVG